ncbi:MAG TPA: ATP-dependent metallopeptidase FtsH/Yme1/Tma family protein, partial [Polyangia bacterium]
MPNDPPTHKPVISNTVAALVFLGMLALLFTLPWFGGNKAARSVPYSELVTMIESDRVEHVTVGRTEIGAELRGDAPKRERVRAERLPGLDPAKLVELLQRKGVKYSGSMDEASFWSALFTWGLPFAILALYFWSARRGAAGGAMRFGRASAKIYDKRGGERVTFADVAGVDDAVADLTELVDFLKQPERYRAIGAHVPRGVL